MWNKLASEESIKKVIAGLEAAGITVTLVDTKEEALEAVKKLIPDGSEVMPASSTTVKDIGFMDYLQGGEHKYVNLAVQAMSEPDEAKRNLMRRKIESADYAIGSVNAITEDGKLVAVDGSGSRVGAYAFAAGHVVLVAGTNKIVTDVEQAFKRVKEYVFDLENERMQGAYGFGTTFGKWLIIEREIVKGRINLILVKEVLGF